MTDSTNVRVGRYTRAPICVPVKKWEKEKSFLFLLLSLLLLILLLLILLPLLLLLTLSVGCHLDVSFLIFLLCLITMYVISNLYLFHIALIRIYAKSNRSKYIVFPSNLTSWRGNYRLKRNQSANLGLRTPRWVSFYRCNGNARLQEHKPF